MKTRPLAAAALLAAAFTATACTATPAPDNTTPTQPTTSPAVPTPTTSTPTQNPTTQPPFEITPQMLGTTINLNLWQQAVFRGFPPADGYEIVEYQPSDTLALPIPSDTPLKETGFTAVKPGTTTLTLLSVNNGTRTPVGTITVNVQTP